MAILFLTLAVLAVASVGSLAETTNAIGSSGRSYTSILSVPNGMTWGEWTWREMCPDTTFALGFSLRVEPSQGKDDDTALNGIRLICGKGYGSFLSTIESHIGYWGDWTHAQYCPNNGVLIAFQLRVESMQGGGGDDTAANNIKFRCSTGPIMEGAGMKWGEYGSWSEVCTDGGICGIKTRMEPHQAGGGDDTALNDVMFYCC